MQMQRFPGVICYCCGEELGSNVGCGSRASTKALRARPPCLWAHTDPEIVQRCNQKAKVKVVPGALGITRFLPVGTPVFVPPIMGGYGLRGVVRFLDAENGRCTVEFEGRSNVPIQSGSVDARKVLHYIDQSNIALYPSDALPLNSSVRCVIDDKLRRQLSYNSSKHADAESICGIIEGAAVDYSNVAIYYNIGPNISVKQFFLAEDVSLVVEVPPPAEATAAVTVDPPTEKTEVVVLESSSSSSEFENPQPPVSKALGGVKGKGGVGSKKDEGKAQATFKAPRAPQRTRGKGGAVSPPVYSVMSL